MSLVAGEYARITCNFELGDGTQYQNVYHYLRDGVGTVSDAVTVSVIKTRVQDMYATLAGMVKNDVVEKLCFVDKVAWVLTEWKVTANIGTFTPTFTPTSADEGLPYTVSPFVVFKTTRPRTVGRKFLFPFTEPAQADSILVASAVTAVVAYGALALVDLALGTDATAIPGVLRTGVEQWLSFQVAVVNDVLGSQKRRRPGVGA